MKQAKVLGLTLLMAILILSLSVVPAYSKALQQMMIEPVTAVKNSTEFYNAFGNAIKNNKASLAVSISSYDPKTYNLEAALSQALEGIRQSSTLLAEYKSVSKLTGKSARLDTTFKYESADTAAYTEDALYDAALKAAKEAKPRLSIKTTKQLKDTLDVNRLYQKGMAEGGELFYLKDLAYTWSVPGQGSYCILTIDFLYAYDRVQLTAVKAELDKKVAEITGKVISSEMTENDKELALHDYLVRSTAYDISGTEESYTPYGVLIKGKGNSYGYAMAMQLLLSRAGIESRIVAGDGGAWNIVRIEGDYYHLDASNDSMLDGEGKVIVTHDYFNLPDEEMAKTHTWNRSEQPACTSMKANYYIKNNTMANNEQEMYEVLKNAIENVRLSAGVKVVKLEDAEKVSELVRKIVSDHPDLGYLASWRWQINDSLKTVSIMFTYQYPAEQLLAMKRETEARVNDIVGQLIKPEMTDYLKELLLHDYIINHARYDTEGIKSNKVPFEQHDAYGVLIDGLGVCDSYAEAFKMLLNKAGIECMVVEGDEINTPGADNDLGHAWNIVKIDGEYYHVDPTWDDPVSEDGTQTLTRSYFNLTDEEMAKTHTWEKSKYPACTATKFNYYVKNGRFAENKSDVARIIRNALANKDYQLEIKIKNYKESAYDLRSILQSALNSSRARNAGWGIDPITGVVEIQFGY